MSTNRWSLARLAAGAALVTGLVTCGGSASQGPQAPGGLSYAGTSFTATVGQEVAPLQPTVQGSVDHYLIAPALPAGLTFDARTGVLAGTPTTPSPETTYTINAINGVGLSSTQIQIAVAGLVPDLRFQWARAFPYTLAGSVYTLGTPPLGAGPFLLIASGTAHFSPLCLDTPTGDGWDSHFLEVDFPLVGGTTSTYTAERLGTLNARLDDLLGQGLVVSSLDLSLTGFGVVAVGHLPKSLEYHTVRTTFPTLADLAAWATSQGQAGAILTAVATFGRTADGSPAAGPILALAARRDGDANTYEAQVVDGTPEDLARLLPPLGLQGYLVTAFGAGSQADYVAVLTRAAGSTTPHIIQVQPPLVDLPAALASGLTPAGRMTGLGGTHEYDVLQR